MALGFSGSNGGIRHQHSKPFDRKAFDPKLPSFRKEFPYEISYFVNGICNLRCPYCYVGYTQNKNMLSNEEWRKTLEEAIEEGALTFGNVGMEPLLSFDKTHRILEYLKSNKLTNPRIRYGLVTNATLLDEAKARVLESLDLDWLDVSFDGTRELHDQLRGAGNFSKSFGNLSKITDGLREKVFILFTATTKNVHDLPKLLEEMRSVGIKNFMISPFARVSNQNEVNNEELALSDQELIDMLRSLLDPKGYLDKLQSCEIVVKTDLATTQHEQYLFIELGIIQPNMLEVDDYGVIFRKHIVGSNVVCFNYMPFDDTHIRQVRITQDGFVGGCEDMFHPDKSRFRGNVRDIGGIRHILK